MKTAHPLRIQTSEVLHNMQGLENATEAVVSKPVKPTVTLSAGLLWVCLEQPWFCSDSRKAYSAAILEEREMRPSCHFATLGLGLLS